MNTILIRWTTAISVLFILPAFVDAQGDFFWTNASFDSGQVINQDLTLFVPVGSSKSIYLYWSTFGPNRSELRTGAILHVSTSTPEVIQFEDAEVFDFDVVLIDDPSVVVDERWRSSFNPDTTGSGGVSGPANRISPEEITGLNGFTVGGPGIRNDHTGPMRLDLGYDSYAEAFLHARVDFTVASLGQVTFLIDPDIVDAGETVPAVFTSLIINGIESPILGDVNNDGETSAMDIHFFVERLATSSYQIEADTNSDGSVDLFDIPSFVDMISD